ncbi:MAG TPA: transposase [Terriglobia bacterium]|nr:transposase [Terriglobia bacterium]
MPVTLRQKGNCEVIPKERPSRYRKYPKELRAKALERLKSCTNVTALAKELGVDRTLLYKWRERMEANAGGKATRVEGRERKQEIDELKRLLAEKTLEVDFFKGALQRIAARRQNNIGSGEKASTRKSGN